MALQVVLALDWTPNSNHTGFYVARALGYFAEAGLNDVAFRSPHEDAYKVTPVSLVQAGTATFAICPSESVVSQFTWPEGGKARIKAVAACLQTSTSAIVTLKSSGLDRPALLDNKRYASYAARYEGRIVQKVIQADGGKGDFVETTPPMLGIWNTLLSGEADATWIFEGWEGVQAKRAGVELNSFKLEDYGVPYGYSPVLVARTDVIKESPDVLRSFLAAAARGFEFAAQDPDQAATLMLQEVAKDTATSPLPDPLDPAMLQDAQAYAAQHYLHKDSKKWGVMEARVWDGFLDFLHDSGLLTTKVQSRSCSDKSNTTTSLDGLRQGDVGELLDRAQVPSAELFTNELLPV